MATFSETFLCTALPEGISGQHLTVAVLISPRLGSDSPSAAPLDSWPDARDWPAIRPTWTLTITQGATTVTVPAAEVVATPYDLTSWQDLFPHDRPVTPYVTTDRSAAPIRSYPSATIRDAAKALHVDVLTHSRTDPPTVRDLMANATFEAAAAAADPATAAAAAERQSGAPPTAGSLTLTEAFAMAGLFHASSAGFATPVVTGVSPASGPDFGSTAVTVSGFGFTGATAVNFGSTPATGVVVASDNKITCTSPSHTDGSVDVTVVTPEGTSPTSPADKFDFVTTVK